MRFGRTSITDAISHCNNLQLGGYNDWALSSKDDIISLINDKCSAPDKYLTINCSSCMGACRTILFLKSDYHLYWTSDRVIFKSWAHQYYYNAEVSRFNLGSIPHDNFYAKCVR